MSSRTSPPTSLVDLQESPALPDFVAALARGGCGEGDAVGAADHAADWVAAPASALARMAAVRAAMAKDERTLHACARVLHACVSGVEAEALPLKL
eukprot:CAMPEP_0206060142 /NCGR_PEP_ID=MMETSP1466-20131121/50558_1 /ASSEMBLY_ACC=CAM_ASM_001126 /TAXON_ID=44452 /ORGANISM="Pavlova gyrans, Strain CCMP608" /LENGTH=95 /DNA_ID=CAMNT_0053435475 /DNA_START=1 /DNA_END=285 /DNA_ORIENTATION=+